MKLFHKPIGTEKYWIFMPNENFYKLAIKELAKKTICDGHLYLSAKDNRRFYVMQPGMIIEEDFIKKHALQNTVFDFLPVVDSEIRQHFQQLFKELKYSQFEKDQRNKSVEILREFHRIFTGEIHFLSFALAVFDEFCLVPTDALKQMHNTDLNLFRKSLYSSAFAIITAISSDFYQYMILRDFYNLTLALDIGLCDVHYSYYVAKGCNQENKFPGTGAAWMRSEKASQQEIEVFLNHPRKSYEFIKSLSILSFPELSEIVLYQHELSSGKGFPRGVTKGQVSSWEAVVLLASSMVEIEDSFPFETRVADFLKSFTNQKLSELPVARAHNKLCKAFDYFDETKETGS